MKDLSDISQPLDIDELMKELQGSMSSHTNTSNEDQVGVILLPWELVGRAGGHGPLTWWIRGCDGVSYE